MFSILKSRTFWTALVLGAYNTATMEFGLFPGVWWLPIIINGLGVTLITYFHVNPSQTYNPVPPATIGNGYY
jgi:hypothetical protein